MRLAYYLCLIVLILLLNACGLPEQTARSSASATATIQTPGPRIAELLRQTPVAGKAVEVDAYNWAGDRGQYKPSYRRDAKGCPVFQEGSVLTDRPIPEFIWVLGGIVTNFSSAYPPDAASWLIPTPASGIPGSLSLPYQGRLRGHLGDPAFAKCAHADRIFVVEGIVTTYEQSPPTVERSILPATYASWARYHDAKLGYSFAYPADWQVEPLNRPDVIAALRISGSQWPNYPITVQVHDGETYYDSLNVGAVPPLLKSGHTGSFFNQDKLFPDAQIATQHLFGAAVEQRTADPNLFGFSVLLNDNGRTYEVALQYPYGFNAQPDLINHFAAIIASVQFDVPPGPTPTSPIKQTLGAGPFLSKNEVLARFQKQMGTITTFSLTAARLMSEAETRTQHGCETFQGHPDGIWTLAGYATYDNGAAGNAYASLDATTGEILCGGDVTTLLPTAPAGTAEPTVVLLQSPTVNTPVSYPPPGTQTP